LVIIKPTEQGVQVNKCTRCEGQDRTPLSSLQDTTSFFEVTIDKDNKSQGIGGVWGIGEGDFFAFSFFNFLKMRYYGEN